MCTVHDKVLKLESILLSYKPLVIAFSGGIDSSFLAYCAHRILGKSMTAVTICTPFSIKAELKHASQFAQQHGFRHEMLDLNILDNEDVTRNDSRRCYFCKKYILGKIYGFAVENGFNTIADGSTRSDNADYRPGKEALKDYGVKSPLESAGFTRDSVLEGLEYFNIVPDNVESYSCLATRVAYGDVITIDVLKKIENAENNLKKHGLGVLRVRCHGHVARIELSRDDIQQAVLDDSLRKKIIESVKKAGFTYVTIDLEGLRSGSMNNMLSL